MGMDVDDHDLSFSTGVWTLSVGRDVFRGFQRRAGLKTIADFRVSILRKKWFVKEFLSGPVFLNRFLFPWQEVGISPLKSFPLFLNLCRKGGGGQAEEGGAISRARISVISETFSMAPTIRMVWLM